MLLDVPRQLLHETNVAIRGAAGIKDVLHGAAPIKVRRSPLYRRIATVALRLLRFQFNTLNPRVNHAS
jgi:hypothetical protein